MSRHRFVDDTPSTWTACIAPHATDPERPRTATVGLLCTGHHRDLEQKLAELPALLAEAEATLIRGSSGGPKITGTKEQPLPYATDGDGNSPASDATRAARSVLASWCLLVIAEHPGGLHPPANDTGAMSRWLLTHLEWCCEQMWVDDLLREIRETRVSLRRPLTATRSRRIPLGPCDAAVSCDLTTHVEHHCTGVLTAVVHSDDDGLPTTIACRDCGIAHPPATWRPLARRLRKDAEPMLTYAQLSQLLVVPIGTLKRWAHEDAWRRFDGRPSRFHHDDAQRSYDTRRLEETA